MAIILGLFFIIELWYSVQPMGLWWDSAIYIGMGKYLFSSGTIGVWEAFRPPLLPIIYGSFWKLCFDPIIVGKILAVACALGAVYVTYLLSEKVKEGSGIISMIFLGFSPIFLAFSVIPLSDIPSTFICLCAVYAFLNKKYTWSGAFVGIAFLARFPQALMLTPLLFTLVLSSKNYKATIINSLKILISFFVVISPYLISNYILYHNPLYPIIKGNQVAIASLNNSNYYVSYFYYLKNIFIQNPLIILSLIFLFIVVKNFQKINTQTRTAYLIILMTLIIIGSYFSSLDHKELRYSIAFLPYLFIAASVGLSYILEKVQDSNIRKKVFISTCIFITTMLILENTYVYSTYFPLHASNQAQHAYMHFFDDKPNAVVMTTSPQLAAYGNIHIAELGDTWEHMEEAYTRQYNTLEYITLDMCNVSCAGPANLCKNAQDRVVEKIKAENTLVFNQEFQGCLYTIYKKD